MITQTETTKRTKIFDELKNQVGELKSTYTRLITGKKIHSSKNAEEIFRPLFAEEMDTRESFRAMYLLRNNTVICTNLISIGTETGCIVSVQEVLRGALLCKAQAIILSHNHPSGEIRPSQADKDITKKIKQAAELMDINVLDHIILSSETFYSFADEGQM